jgi:tRNA pseudouridine65 synthase
MVYTSNKARPVEGNFVERYNNFTSSKPQYWRNLVTSLVIHYEDEDLIAVSKPAGMLVHRTRIASGEGPFLLQQVRDLTGRYLYPVHRLDRPTSGILLFATSPDSARALSESFRNNAVRKSYIAIIRGWPEEKGSIDSPLGRPSEDIPGKPAARGNAQKDAFTEYMRLATVELPYAVFKHPTSRYSLVRVHPLTGRRHQIRKHLRRISHPVIGDVEYGDGRHNRFFRNQFGIRRLLLHAESISLRHPATGEALTITSPPPGEFEILARSFGWNPSLLVAREEDQTAWKHPERGTSN